MKHQPTYIMQDQVQDKISKLMHYKNRASGSQDRRALIAFYCLLAAIAVNIILTTLAI